MPNLSVIIISFILAKLSVTTQCKEVENTKLNQRQKDTAYKTDST